jgi:hypothetical protein
MVALVLSAQLGWASSASRIPRCVEHDHSYTKGDPPAEPSRLTIGVCCATGLGTPSWIVNYAFVLMGAPVATTGQYLSHFNLNPRVWTNPPTRTRPGRVGP